MVKIGVVVPTTFERPEYLLRCLESIANQEGDFELQVLVGCPSDVVDSVRSHLQDTYSVVSDGDSRSLASALSILLGQLDEDCTYITWLGDDDALKPLSLATTSRLLNGSSDAVFAYGGCEYVDESGLPLFTNMSGMWAAHILRFGPQLIPQPGSLMSRLAFFRSGGINPAHKLAFDFDLLLRLKKLGSFIYVNQVLAEFRWHPSSLSVNRRLESALGASRVRFANNPYPLKAMSVLWEPALILATWGAGKAVSLYSRIRGN